jgi:hypothetical protein
MHLDYFVVRGVICALSTASTVGCSAFSLWKGDMMRGNTPQHLRLSS